MTSQYFVYAISSLTRKYIYVGMTNNPARRIKQHNDGKERTTRAYRPFRQIYLEEFPNREFARVKEKFLKTGIGKEYLKSLLLGY